MAVVLWLIALVIFIIAEAATMTLVSVWFAVGSLGAVIAAAAGANLLVQFIVFVALSALMLVFTRPMIKKLLPNRYIPTNSELDIGKEALVISRVDRNKGRVRLDGIDWNAVSDNGGVIEEGSSVTVISRQGNTLTVSIKNN
ncbi:MAG: NfeD family protein [Oscillospiraceae bacterium]|nr:NfeD family protein [Oscillospiraceae bacterium]MBQ8827410.1 NfeD family protein [Oscillospiraceae bacterium]